MKRILQLCLIALILPISAAAQDDRDQSLAEIRSDLEALNGLVLSLRSEAQAGGGTLPGIPNAAPVLQRLDLIEEEIRRLTGQVEQLGLRIDRVVDDGTKRIGVLEFRLVELEGGDVSTLGKTPPLGGQATAPTVTQPDTTAPVAISEKAAFDAALADYDAGNFAGAAQKLSDFALRYPGGPLTGDATFWLGEALAAQGDWNSAARSYLDSFSGAPSGRKAPEALFRLGVSLGKLGQTSEACLTLNEVPRRYPDISPEIAEGVASEKADLSCS